MNTLKLGLLPDRVPMKLTITVQPGLKKALDDYARLYALNYGAEEEVTELIPYMLDAFLKADGGFRKGRKELEDNPSLPPPVRRRRGRIAEPKSEEES